MQAVDRKRLVTRADRRPVEFRGFALGTSGDCDAKVRDQSYCGCGIRSDDRFEAGEVVELPVVKRGAVQAEIRWAYDDRAGVRFLN